MKCLRPLEHWKFGFESHSRHGCLCVSLFCVYVVLCVGRGLSTGWSSVQGVLPPVYMNKKLKTRPRPNKGLQNHNNNNNNNTTGTGPVNNNGHAITLRHAVVIDLLSTCNSTSRVEASPTNYTKIFVLRHSCSNIQSHSATFRAIAPRPVTLLEWVKIRSPEKILKRSDAFPFVTCWTPWKSLKDMPKR
jgi:hypothetical protein